MNSVLVKVWIGVLLVALGGYGAFTILRMGGYFAEDAPPPAEPRRIVELKPGEELLSQLADVELVERSGANFRWSQLEGQPWVANVFYTTCTKECVMLSAQVGYLQRSLSDVRFVSITCDPDRDDTSTLRKYAEQYQADPARWFFLTGDMRDIRRATEVLFGFPTKRIDHSPYLALMDAQGRFVEMYSVTQPRTVEMLKAKIKELQGGAAAESGVPDANDTEEAATGAPDDDADADDDTGGDANGGGATEPAPAEKKS